MSGFAIQFNKNSFGIAPAAPLTIGNLLASQSLDASLQLSTNGPVQRMDPLTTLQVAVKNNVDIFYYACQIPLQVLFCEDGQLDKRVFLTTWKDIPAANEVIIDWELRKDQLGLIGTELNECKTQMSGPKLVFVFIGTIYAQWYSWHGRYNRQQNDAQQYIHYSQA